MRKPLAAAVVVPAAVLAFGACTSAPEFTQFRTPKGDPIPAAENGHLNEVQHKLDRPLDNTVALAAVFGAAMRCQRYVSPVWAHLPDPLTTVAGMPGTDDDREMYRVSLEMAVPQSGLCQAVKAKVDRENAQAATDRARADAEARAHAEAAAQKAASENAARKAKQQKKATEESASRSNGGNSSSGGSSGLSCDLDAPAKVNAQNQITNKACGYTDSNGKPRSRDSWIDDQLKEQQSGSGSSSDSGSSSSGYNGDPQSGEPARQYKENQQRCASGVGPCVHGN